MQDFAPTSRTRLKRRRERAAYDEATVYAVLDAGFIAHVGYVIDRQPYVTPTAYWRDGRRLYWHGSSASRMLRAQSSGLEVCLTVTHIDGLVMARSGFHHSINYRSVMAFGTARVVDDPAERARQLDRFIERLYPGRAAMMRAATRQELKATTMVSMEIAEASAKSRSGPPIDDEADYASDVWAGVVPIALTSLAPIADPLLKPGVEPPKSLNKIARQRHFDEALLKLARRSERSATALSSGGDGE